MARRDLDALCSIAALIQESALALRALGCPDTADILEMAERDLDEKIYAAHQTSAQQRSANIAA